MRTSTDIQLLIKKELLRVRLWPEASKKSNVRFSADFTKALTLGFSSKVFPPPSGVSQTLPADRKFPLGAAPNLNLLLPLFFPARQASDGGGYALSRTYTNTPPVPETHFLQVSITLIEAQQAFRMYCC